MTSIASPLIVSTSDQPVLRAAEQAGGGSGQFLVFGVMMLMIVAMFWFSSRTRRRQQERLRQQQAAMEPGSEVMTSYGLYGRLISKDEEAVKAVIEIAPGTPVTVHLQTLTAVPEPEGTGAAQDSRAPGGSTAAVDADPADSASGPSDPGPSTQR